ncbi:MAG: hypothetical protein ISS92_06260 [Candidatus Omnitrophica bacterium]|nr:hypothetical protein [Candidatus Omnitrophota bacterium]
MAGIYDNIKKSLLSGTAVYLSEDFVDIVKGEITPGGVRISSMQRYPVLKNVKDLTQPEARAELDSIFSKAFEKQKPEKIALNLKDEFLLLRRFSFKQVMDNELEKVVVFEAQKYIPYAIEDLAFGFKKCDKKSGSQEILFVASELRNINTLVKYHQEKKILPSVIIPTPVLIARILDSEHKLEKEKAYISVHYEPSNEIVITGVVDRYPYFFKSVNIITGEDEFKTTEMKYPLLKDIWGAIETDVLQTIEYIKKEAKREVDKIFISGFGYSLNEGITGDDFGVTIERAKFSHFKFKEKNDETRDRFLPAISLLRQAVGEPFINLAPRKIAEQDICIYKPVAAKAGIILCGILALHILLAGVNFLQGKKIESLTGKIKKHFKASGIVSPGASRDEITYYRDITEKKANFIHKAFSDRIYITKKLNELGKDLTPLSWINVVDFRNPIRENGKPTLTIEGAIYAPTEEGITVINNILENIGNDKNMMSGFKEVKLISVRKKNLLEKEITEFEILLQ